MPTGFTPICAECQHLIRPGEELETFSWYEGEKGDVPLDPDLCKAAITHAACGYRFAERVARFQS